MFANVRKGGGAVGDHRETVSRHAGLLRAGRDALGKLPDAHKAVKAAFGGEGAHFLVKLRRERAELAHVAEHRDARSGDIERGERGKRRAH